MEWEYQGEQLDEVPKGAVGFVYKITRTNIGDFPEQPVHYIGKKNFFSGAKGKKGKESDWRKYHGSSAILKADLKEFGKDSYHREILKICYSKSETTYNEMIEQVKRDVLDVRVGMIPERLYYNKTILGKFFQNKFFTKRDRADESTHASKENKEIYWLVNHTEKVRMKMMLSLESVLLLTEQSDDIEFLKDNLPDYPVLDYSHYDNCTNVTNGNVDIPLLEKHDVGEFLAVNTDFVIGYSSGNSVICENGKCVSAVLLESEDCQEKKAIAPEPESADTIVRLKHRSIKHQLVINVLSRDVGFYLSTGMWVVS